MQVVHIYASKATTYIKFKFKLKKFKIKMQTVFNPTETSTKLKNKYLRDMEGGIL